MVVWNKKVHSTTSREQAQEVPAASFDREQRRLALQEGWLVACTYNIYFLSCTSSVRLSSVRGAGEKGG